MSEIRLEQARIELPYIRVFYYGEDYSNAESVVTATLDGTKLLTTVFDAEEIPEGTDYYLLLDITASVGSDYFEAMKQCVLQFQSGMLSEDTITVIAYGDEVTVIADHAGKNEDFSSTVCALVNDNYTTHFWEALTKTASLVDSEENKLTRAVALVLTDGEDCSEHESTEQEALETLQEAGVPLYAMAVKQTASGADNVFLDDLKDFVREANGQTWIFSVDEAESCMAECLEYFQSVHELDFRSSSNRIDATEQLLTVLFPNQESSTLTVYPKYFQTDTEAPTAEIEKLSERELKITYSESVLNADQANNFTVTKDGSPLAIYTLHYESSDGYYTVLTFEEELGNGVYEVTFRNVCDDSTEENLLSGSAVIEVNDVPETETESETETETESETEAAAGTGSNYVLYRGAGFLVLLLLILLLVRRRKKEQKPEETVSIKQQELQFEIVDDEGSTKQTFPADKKLIAGRSSKCDIVLSDTSKMLSNQHFSIEKMDGSFYVTDLDSTNGTRVNGIRITSRCRLKNGDVIQAGSLKIIITW
ncbi:MAG: FHA domain-containing protein [Lachnospiraceae bacterium]|nr:FHA domain-containing protein [Lachnospiraceae bacterium]